MLMLRAIRASASKIPAASVLGRQLSRSEGYVHLSIHSSLTVPA